jgi:hypothetical protein
MSKAGKPLGVAASSSNCRLASLILYKKSCVCCVVRGVCCVVCGVWCVVCGVVVAMDRYLLYDCLLSLSAFGATESKVG